MVIRYRYTEISVIRDAIQGWNLLENWDGGLMVWPDSMDWVVRGPIRLVRVV